MALDFQTMLQHLGQAVMDGGFHTNLADEDRAAIVQFAQYVTLSVTESPEFAEDEASTEALLCTLVAAGITIGEKMEAVKWSRF